MRKWLVFNIGNFAFQHGWLGQNHEWYYWYSERRGFGWLATLCNRAGDWK